MNAGFDPFCPEGSRVLILGSFPSVMSRAQGFYYGNPQNRLWRTLASFFGEETPGSVAERQEFLRRRKIAMWDVVASCDIEGSSDASIKNVNYADLPALVKACGFQAILCNGATAYGLLAKRYPELLPLAVRLPSTSPANPRFSQEIWHETLSPLLG